MNKKIKEATKEEIREAYINKVPSMISNIRFRVYSEQNNIFSDMRTGEIISRSGFNLFVAEKFDKGFEFRIYQSNKDRRQRLETRINRIISSDKAKFLTLTFNDKYLSKDISQETRRRYIARFLKEQCSEYVANIDFGEREDKTHREHYHAIVIPKSTRIDYAPYCAFFDNSRIYSEDIKPSDKSSDNLSRYINKLTNHSLKASGQYRRLIYSRDIKSTLN